MLFAQQYALYLQPFVMVQLECRLLFFVIEDWKTPEMQISAFQVKLLLPHPSLNIMLSHFLTLEEW